MAGRPGELAELERRRDELLRELARMGDFRPGSLNAVMRRCGKPNCACADPDHPGHGPQYNLTRSVEGRTRTEHLKPGPELDKARREVAEYQRFRDLVAQVTEVNEAICRARPAAPQASAGSPSGTEGGAVAGARGRGRGGGRQAGGRGGRLLEGGAALDAAEAVLRAGLLELGGSVLGQLLAADSGHRGPRVPCGIWLLACQVTP